MYTNKASTTAAYVYYSPLTTTRRGGLCQISSSYKALKSRIIYYRIYPTNDLYYTHSYIVGTRKISRLRISSSLRSDCIFIFNLFISFVYGVYFLERDRQRERGREEIQWFDRMEIIWSRNTLKQNLSSRMRKGIPFSRLFDIVRGVMNLYRTFFILSLSLFLPLSSIPWGNCQRW